jgi:cytochrome c peroxidase
MAAKAPPSARKVASILVAVALLAQGLVVGVQPAHAQVQTYTCPTGFGVGLPILPPLILLSSLKTVPNPVLPSDPITGLPMVRDDLLAYIANLPAAIQLGKALFWDMQAGSDNKTACATCHFKAGADGRTKNQLNPGPTGSGFSANSTLTPADFPFTDFLASPPIDADSIAGSQGVRKSKFVSIGKSGAESTTSVADPVFNVGGVNVRQVTGKNTPSTINAVFNHRNFWNGRAQPEFNGVNPWGNRDPSVPRVWMMDPTKGFPVAIDIHITNASPASQAVGPALNDVEMSAAGRTFPDLGKKMLVLKPQGLQKVSPTDSVLGSIADTTAGLKVSYKTLIQTAFQPKWWNSTKSVNVGGKNYSMMEANFSLYWGLAIMLYEATLVSDDTPMDQFLATRVFDPLTGALLAEGNPDLLNQAAARLQADYGYTGGVAGILNGLKLFEDPLPPVGTGRQCIACHLGANTTSASVANLVGGGAEPGDVAFKNAGFNIKMERMFMQIPAVPTDLLSIMQNVSPTWYTTQVTLDPSTYGVTVTGVTGTPVPPVTLPAPARVAVYDGGWYNLGVRPSGDDAGLGGKDPFGNFLSWTQLYQTTLSDSSIIKVPGGGGLGCVGAGNATFPGEVLNANGFPILSGPLRATEGTDVPGTFKTSALRNVELNGPYFHNGGKSTLLQVVNFYDNGGDFANDTQSPLIKFYGFLSKNSLGMTAGEQADLVAFLIALTDERVRLEKAPFDHPQLFVPNGDTVPGTDDTQEIPAVGAGGASTPLTPFLSLNPFQP